MYITGEAKILKDWKGQEVELGDTVLIIMYKALFGGMKTTAMLIDGDGKIVSKSPVEMPIDYQWTIVNRFLVTKGNEVQIFTDPEKVGKLPIIDSGRFLSLKVNQIVCIEGKSDDRDEFFIKYFEA